MSIYGPETVYCPHMNIYGPEGSTAPAKFDGNMAGKRIINVGPPRADTDAATRGFVANADQRTIDTALGLFMARDGSTRPTADISFGGKALKNLAGPAEEDDAATMGYVDLSATLIARALEGKCLLRDGSNLPTRELSMGAQRLAQVAPPLHPGDAANKAYVDRRVSSVRRFHFRLGMRLAGKTGVITGMFHIPNTDERFTTDPNFVFVTLTPVSTPLPFCLYGKTLDRNYLQVAIEVDVREAGPLNVVFNTVVEVTSAENYTSPGPAPPRALQGGGESQPPSS